MVSEDVTFAGLRSPCRTWPRPDAHTPGGAILFPTHHVYVYDGGVANMTIYLDDSLKQRVKLAKLQASRICQQALRAELEREGASFIVADRLAQLTVDDMLAEG